MSTHNVCTSCALLPLYVALRPRFMFALFLQPALLLLAPLVLTLASTRLAPLTLLKTCCFRALG